MGVSYLENLSVLLCYILTCPSYLEEYPNSDPRKMEDMKHFAKFVGRSTKPRLEAYPTVRSIRRKVRTFMSAWQRETKLAIPKDVHDSMAPVSNRRPPSSKSCSLTVNSTLWTSLKRKFNYLQQKDLQLTLRLNSTLI